MSIKPIPYNTPAARVKGCRASGGTRYYQGKKNGEDRMARFVQEAIDNHKRERELAERKIQDLSLDELLLMLKKSSERTRKILEDIKKNREENHNV